MTYPTLTPGGAPPAAAARAPRWPWPAGTGSPGPGSAPRRPRSGSARRTARPRPPTRARAGPGRRRAWLAPARRRAGRRVGMDRSQARAAAAGTLVPQYTVRSVSEMHISRDVRRPLKHVAGAGMPCPCISRRDAAAQHVSGNKHGRHGVSSALVGRCDGSARVHTRPQPALLSAAVPATLTQRTHSGYPQGSKRCRRRIKRRVFALATSEQT